MKNRKKILAGMCIASMVISLAACGNTGTKDSPAADDTVAETIPPTEEPVTEPTAEPEQESTPEPEKEEVKKEVQPPKTFVSKSKKQNKYLQSKTTSPNAQSASSLKSWKNSKIKKQLVKFVEAATDENSDGYIPPEDRIVVSDIDGTLIAEKGHKVDNDEMVPKTPAKVKDYILSIQDDYFDEEKELVYSAILYQPMMEMYDYLTANGFDVYFVSGNCNSLTYAWANYYFGADYSHSIGSNIYLEIDDTDGFKMGPTGQYEGSWNEVKCYRIYNQIGKCPVLAFGNSDGDIHMLRWVLTNPDYPSLSIMINHDDEREYVYSTDTVSTFCENYGFLDAKISENFKTVFVK